MRRRRRATSGCGRGRGRVGVVGETASSREMIGGRRCTGQERQTAAGAVVVMVVEVVSSVWRERGGEWWDGERAKKRARWVCSRGERVADSRYVGR
jgi:hypothetical protein